MHLIAKKQCQVIWTIYWITRLHEQHCSECLEIKSFTENPWMEQNGDKQRYRIYLKPLGTSRSVRALWYIWRNGGKEMSPFEGLDDKGTCPSQLSTHSITSPSANTEYLHVTDNCWRYSCGTLFCIKERFISPELYVYAFCTWQTPFLLDQAPMSPFSSLSWCPQAKLAHIPACPPFPNN